MSRLVVFCLVIVATAAGTIDVPRSDSRAAAFDFIPLPDGVTGAESLAFDPRGQGPYTGVSDGRVLRWDGSARGWTTFAYSNSYAHHPSCTASSARPSDAEDVCGRPLGLQFNIRTGDLYIADAYHGLLRVGPAGGEAEVVATMAGGEAFNFLNGVDVDQSTGDVYFTDSSTSYTRRQSALIFLTRDSSGRLMKYDTRAKRVIVLKDGLPFPNGVALSADRTHVVVAHTWPCQLFRYWLEGPKAGIYELFADLPGYPDNIRRDKRGGYWVALNQETIDVLAAVASKHIVGVCLDAKGVQLEEMTAEDKRVTFSEIAEEDVKLWLGSVELDYVVVVDQTLLDYINPLHLNYARRHGWGWWTQRACSVRRSTAGN
jgi:sugar lactone lactonase YvrE